MVRAAVSHHARETRQQPEAASASSHERTSLPGTSRSEGLGAHPVATNEPLSVAFFHQAFQRIKDAGYAWEVEAVENRDIRTLTSEELYRQYVFVVFSTGMKNQVADKMYQKFMEGGRNPELIRHPQKRKAIERANREYRNWFRELMGSKDRLGVISSLPFIGPITRFHLARNIGLLEYAKPDRHLTRLAARFGFVDAQALCEHIGKAVGLPAGVVDVILWRDANLG